MSIDELDLGEFNFYAGGLCLDLSPGKAPERVALIAEAVNAQTGDITDKRAFIDRFRAQGKDEFAAISLASVFIHETRHFHDLLLTHVGQWLLTEGLNLASGLPGTLFFLGLQRACVLPISHWRNLSPELYDTLVPAAMPGGLSLKPPRMLLERLNALAEVAEITHYFYQPPLDAPSYAPSSTLLFEGLATSCQLAELNRIDTGDRLTVHSFVRRLEARKARTYIDYFDYIETAAKQLGNGNDPEHWTVFNLLALRSLCPLTRSVTESGEPLSLPPALIFLAGIADLHQRKSIPKLAESIAWIDSLADRLGWLTLDETFEAMQKMAPQRFSSVQALFNPAISSDAALLKGYKEWIAAHQHMLSEVRRDPLAYCDPFLYCAASRRWVACPLKLPIVNDNLLQIEAFLRGLESAHTGALDVLLSHGLKPGFLTIGSSFGKELLSSDVDTALFGVFGLAMPFGVDSAQVRSLDLFRVLSCCKHSGTQKCFSCNGQQPFFSRNRRMSGALVMLVTMAMKMMATKTV